MQQIVINLKSFDLLYIKKCTNQLYSIIKNIKVESVGETPLPITQKEVTVLKSPHTDKKSREQFEWKRWKTRVSIRCKDLAKSHLLLFILKNSEFPGVQLEISVIYSTFLKKIRG